MAGLLTAAVPIGVRASPAKSEPRRILVMGDSLSAEYGLPRGSGWVNLLVQRLHERRIPAEVFNASISGETTSGGLTRLPEQLSAYKPTHVVIELGANDGLRGQAVKQTEANLQAMIDRSRQAGAKVVLVGMMMPPNYGRHYAEAFAAMYRGLAQRNGAGFVPFFLKGIADRPDAHDWFQPDGIHPLAKGHPLMMEQVWAALRPLL